MTPRLTRRNALTLTAGAAFPCVEVWGSAAWAATPPGTLVIARDISDVLTCDPHEAFEISDGDPLNNIYRRLIGRDKTDLSTPAPDIAESWEAAPDGRSMTFRIGAGQSFHTGRKLTAEDAAFSLQRGILLAKTPAFITRQFGWTVDNVRDMVRADGDNVVLRFARPTAPDLVLSALTAAIASVVDRTEVLAHETNGDLGNAWLRNHSAGSGPYRLTAWRPKEGFVLEASPGASVKLVPRHSDFDSLAAACG